MDAFFRLCVSAVGAVGEGTPKGVSRAGHKIENGSRLKGTHFRWRARVPSQVPFPYGPGVVHFGQAEEVWEAEVPLAQG